MPEVSVILPVYNAAVYLKKAIDSILAQTFTDFELLIINDGSTDRSEEIIFSYNDQRIRYLKNEGNKGLIYSLNRAIDEAKGKYIARMDADDICFQERLAEQRTWLINHPSTAVVASFSNEIDEQGQDRGFFEPDRKTVTAAEIRQTMPVQNCITHPAVMGRAEIFRAYRYAATQRNIEDYDLWLRILADGGIIEKIPRPLLWYRVHQDSVTQTKLRKKNFFWKHFQAKRRFLAQRVKKGKLNSFDLRVATQMLLDLGKGAGKALKQMVVQK